MRFLSKQLALIALALIVTCAAHAEPSSNTTTAVPAFNPVIADWLAPPPPPPPLTCQQTCEFRYERCIALGTNAAVCAGKRNYCLINC